MSRARILKVISSVEPMGQDGQPLLIFGAGAVAEILHQACLDAGLRVECFCDNNINKTKALFCGKKVVSVPNLPALYPKASFLVSAADVADVVAQLFDLGYQSLYSGAELLRGFNIGAHTFSIPYDFAEYAVTTYLQCHDGWLHPDKVFLRSVDIIVTERCTQRCRDCSNLMQYYEKPQNVEMREIFRDLDALLAAVDGINEFRIIGGEPLVNRDYYLVVERLSKEPKVKRTVIYTNATLLPEPHQLAALKDPKVLFIVTDYGPASRKLEELKTLLTENKIAFYVTKAGGWSDCAKICRHNRIAEQMREVFRNCCAKNTFTLTKGRFFRCPFSANAYRLQALPDFRDDWVVVAAEEGAKDTATVKKELRALVTELDFIHACEYCNGRPFGAPEIVPGIQTDKPLPF